MSTDILLTGQAFGNNRDHSPKGFECNNTRAPLRTQVWPSEGLEAVQNCPACQHDRKTLLYDRLWDATFQVAPGEWSLWRCGACRSAYLDPRPTEATIGAAYGSYYTHVDEDAGDPKGGLFTFLKKSLANGYRNWRFGSRFRPSSKLGPVVFYLAPAKRQQSDHLLRYLPKLDGRPKSVLDIGCGSGGWLSFARDAGWIAHGADPDRSAVRVAQSQGLDVRVGDINAWTDVAGRMDAVTMSHVIEHVHDPFAVLTKAFKLLRPGGQLYVETPNIDAGSHAAFGANWRGLETPRHLVIFNQQSLMDILHRAGFISIKQRPGSPDVLSFLIDESQRIATLSGDVQIGLRDTALRQNVSGPGTEFLTFTCRRPERPSQIRM